MTNTTNNDRPRYSMTRQIMDLHADAKALGSTMTDRAARKRLHRDIEALTAMAADGDLRALVDAAKIIAGGGQRPCRAYWLASPEAS